MTSRNRSGDDENFSDPVKLVHTSEDRTFITDERFIDAEIIDLGDLLSPEEDAEYDPPQKIQTPMPTVVTPPGSCRNRFHNPSVTLVDCCKRPSKKKRLKRYCGTNELANELKKVKHQEQNNGDSATDSDIEIIDLIDTNETKNKAKASKCLNHEKEIQKAIVQRNLFKIDIKKNTGLVGMKIKRPNVTFNERLETNSTENTKKEKKSKPSVEKVSKKTKRIHKVKTNTNLNKKDEKVIFKSKPKENTTKKIKKTKDPVVRRHSQENVSKIVDNFEKQTDSDVSKSPVSKWTLSPKGCKDVEKPSRKVKNICEHVTKIKDGLYKNMSVEIIPLENKEKYIDLKENDVKCGNKLIIQNVKENGKNNDTEEINVMQIAAGQLNPKTNSVMKQRSFPNLNKFTKNILRKIQKVNTMSPKQSAVKINQKDMKSNKNLYIEKNDSLPRKEASKKCEDQQSDDTKKNDTNDKNNYDRKNNETKLVPKLPCSRELNTNIELKSPLRGNQNFTANNCKVQPANYSPSPLAQSIELHATEASVVKLPFQFSSMSCNISLIDPKTNAQLQHNILNINNTKETQHEKMSVQPLERIAESLSQKQPIPEALRSLSFGNAKPPSRSNGNIVQKVNYVYPSFPDVRMMKKSPKPPHNMNMYRPPPNACTPPYQSFYPMTMPSVPVNSGLYTVNNQNYGCRVGSYMLPYGTEIFPYPPPQPPLPPPPLPPPPPPPQTLPPVSQQQLQQAFPYPNQLSNHNSIIGRNNDGVIKKINIHVPPSTEPDIFKVDERIIKVKNIADNTQHKPKNVNEAVAITPTVIKPEMFKELDTAIQSGNVTHSTKANLKRPPTSKLPIRDENKKNKPCPLSKKVKVSDPRTLPNKGQLNKEPVTNGYSPPILPLPTFENILLQTSTYDARSIHDTIVEKPANKVFSPRHDHTEVKKISLEDYKKKRAVPSCVIKDNKYLRLDKLIKNLCQK